MNGGGRRESRASTLGALQDMAKQKELMKRGALGSRGTGLPSLLESGKCRSSVAREDELSSV